MLWLEVEGLDANLFARNPDATGGDVFFVLPCFG